MSRMRRRLTAALCCVAALVGPEVLAGEARVREQQTIAELLGGKPGVPATPASASVGRPAADFSPAWKLGAAGTALGMLVVISTLILRQRARGRAPREAGAIQVVGRAQLSHRHAVFVLGVSGRRLVVGVSGDRMTALGGFEEPAPAQQVPEPCPAPVPAAGAGRGFSVRPEDRQQLLEAQALDESELRPYRKQMDRLRGLLRDMRGESPGEAV